MDGEEDLKALCSLVINNFYGASIKSHDRNLSLIRANFKLPPSFLPSFHSLSCPDSATSLVFPGFRLVRWWLFESTFIVF